MYHTLENSIENSRHSLQEQNRAFVPAWTKTVKPHVQRSFQVDIDARLCIAVHLLKAGGV